MAINPTHVVMGRNIAASGSLAGEMKVAAISGSTGLTLNQMLIRLDDNATDLLGDAASAYNTLGKIEDVVIANDAALRGNSASAYDDLGKIEDFIIALQADVDANELASDSAESALDVRLDVIEHASGVGSIAKAQADAQAFATTSINNLIDGAPGALDTLNELAAALGDDASFGTTVTNSIAAVQADVNANEVVFDAILGVGGASNLGAFTGVSIADAQTVKQALQALETKAEADAVHMGNLVTLSGVAEDAAHLGSFTGTSIQDDRTVKQALQELETKADGQTTDLDLASGFHVESGAGVYKLGWGSGKPRVSFSISGADVTMSVDVE